MGKFIAAIAVEVIALGIFYSLALNVPIIIGLIVFACTLALAVGEYERGQRHADVT